MFSFYMGLTTKADGIETDIQRTKDGVLVLFHDNDLKRILGKEGVIRDFTYDELLTFDFGAFKGPEFAGEPIVKLEDFFIHFGKRDLTFALEIKQVGIEKEVLDMIEQFGLRDKVILTSFYWESLLNIRAIDSDIRVGFLTKEVTDQTFRDLIEHHMQQICPKIGLFTEEQTKKARKLGLSIRYWGVTSAELMMKAVESDCDGMTVNDPLALSKVLGRI